MATGGGSSRVYLPAVGPKLHWLLRLVFVLAAILGANSVYLVSITVLQAYFQSRGENVILQNYFYQLMFLAHIVLGLLFAVPLVAFAVIHLSGARKRRNRPAVRMGLLLFAVCLVLIGSGFVLMRLEGVLEINHPQVRRVAYWLHAIAPLAAIWVYVLHRLAGPPIKWKLGFGYGAAVGAVVAAMAVFHSHDPRKYNVEGPKEGKEYFEPALALTADGNFISRQSLQMNDYCAQCHQDEVKGWFHSAHHFSSFNNKAYLFSVKELRDRSMKTFGNVKPSRFCAACHDPVPFFSGAFDNPNYDIENDPTAKAGITCTTCHSITHVNGTRGNGDYTIEEPMQYPFAFSDNPILKYINRQLIRAKPDLHKRTFLKPLHKTAEFCSTCHKVHLPMEVTQYKEFLRGQNHYDTFLLSGVSGHNARAWYYPPKAKENCNSCHMPLVESSDPAAKLFPGAERRSIHNHLFVGANTAVAHWNDGPEAKQQHQDFLKDCVRVDIFGLKDGPGIPDPLVAPLRPKLPVLEPGKKYLIELVVRTLRLGHPLSQGTVDSNQLWVEMTARSGDQWLASNGSMDAAGKVDPWAYYMNVFMLDRNGSRIDRRNVQDIFTPLYDHQIPPGAASVVHYLLEVPDWVTEPISLEAKVKYRKFDDTYLRYVFKEEYKIDIPVSTLAEDRVVLPVRGAKESPEPQTRGVDDWERWNDYGIGLFLVGLQQRDHGEYLGAIRAFEKVESLGRSEGSLNLARALHRQGQLLLAAAALARATEATPPVPPWTVRWVNGLIQYERAEFAAAAASFQSVLEDDFPGARERGFDFSKDYEVINDLGRTLYSWSQRENRPEPARQARRRELLQEAAKTFERTLQIDSENLAAHQSLWTIYGELGDAAKSKMHQELRDRYRPDETARGVADNAARNKDPAANHAAEVAAIYRLRTTAPAAQP
ncbi:MAG: hypothetical protein HYS13_02555 [Planctomycetia bacterium]|nr:hypothetical protein [Planctomycetia bacterium]